MNNGCSPAKGKKNGGPFNPLVEQPAGVPFSLAAAQISLSGRAPQA